MITIILTDEDNNILKVITDNIYKRIIRKKDINDDNYDEYRYSRYFSHIFEFTNYSKIDKIIFNFNYDECKKFYYNNIINIQNSYEIILGNLPEDRYLDFLDDIYKNFIDEIKKCNNLKILELNNYHFTYFSNLFYFGNLINLKELYINNSNFEEFELNGLSNLINLKKIVLNNYVNDNFDYADKLKNIEYIELNNCKNIISIDNFINLKTLIINNCKKLKYLPNPEEYNKDNILPNLTTLKILNCKNLINIPDYKTLNIFDKI